MKPVGNLTQVRVGKDNEPYLIRSLLRVLDHLGAKPRFHCSTGLLGRKAGAGANSPHIADSPDYLLLFPIGTHGECFVVYCFPATSPGEERVPAVPSA